MTRNAFIRFEPSQLVGIGAQSPLAGIVSYKMQFTTLTIESFGPRRRISKDEEYWHITIANSNLPRVLRTIARETVLPLLVNSRDSIVRQTGLSL